MITHATKETEGFIVQSSSGDALVGVLHPSTSTDVVILAHGFQDSKERDFLVEIAEELARRGTSAARFDFSGNGESGGTFQFANYSQQVEELRAVAEHLKGRGMRVTGVVGHSMGGNIVLLYAAKYQDVSKVVNIAGRFHMKEGVVERLGQAVIDEALEKGSAEVRSTRRSWTLTRESYLERMGLDMDEAARTLPEATAVLTVHGDEDRVIPVRDARDFDARICNHKLRVVPGASHNFDRPGNRDAIKTAAADFLCPS